VPAFPLSVKISPSVVIGNEQQFAAPIATVKPSLVEHDCWRSGTRNSKQRGRGADSMLDVNHRRLEGGGQLRRVLRNEKEAAAFRCRALQEGIMDGLIIGEANSVFNNIVLDCMPVEIVQVWPQSMS